MSFTMVPTAGALLMFTIKGEHEGFDAMVDVAQAEMEAAQAGRPLADMHDFEASNGIKVGVIVRDKRP